NSRSATDLSRRGGEETRAMSLKKKVSYCFVIDASIARAAGDVQSKHPIGTQCRAFLQKIRGVCHRMAWNDSIKREWERHQSKFANNWFVSMFSLGKIRKIPENQRVALREAIVNDTEDVGTIVAITKDAYIIEAALETDSRIASLDDK